MTKEIYLDDYFKSWIETYKRPVVSHATYLKYENTYKKIKLYFGKIPIATLNANTYQLTLNEYGKNHAKLTASCFHKQIRACLLDAIDEQIIQIDPTRKAIVTGTEKTSKKAKYLDYQSWQRLITHTVQSQSLESQVIYLAAVTGLRYAEVLGLTWHDIDFQTDKLHVNKTWDHKYHRGFILPKNTSSIRSIDIDKQTILFLRKLQEKSVTKPHPSGQIFYYHNGKQLFSAKMNRYLENLCQSLSLPVISFHGLRHTHASVLLYKGVSVMAVSKRLGHSSVTTTQEVYLHVIKEMENREKSLILQVMDELVN